MQDTTHFIVLWFLDSVGCLGRRANLLPTLLPLTMLKKRLVRRVVRCYPCGQPAQPIDGFSRYFTASGGHERPLIWPLLFVFYVSHFTWRFTYDKHLILVKLDISEHFRLLDGSTALVDWLKIMQESARQVTSDFHDEGFSGSPEVFLSERLATSRVTVTNPWLNTFMNIIVCASLICCQFHPRGSPDIIPDTCWFNFNTSFVVLWRKSSCWCS